MSAGLTSPEAETRRLVHFATPHPSSPPLISSPPRQRFSPENSWLRTILGTVLPIVFITVGMYIQKTSHAGSRSEEPEAAADVHEAHVPQRLLNHALLNRSCAPQLLAHWDSGRKLSAQDAESSVRVLVGAGFVASGLNSLAGFMARLPGACKPPRQAVGFWTSFGGSTSGSARRAATVDADEDDTSVGDGGNSGWRLPPDANTRQRYLHSVGYLPRGSGCTVPWELTERYTSIGVRHYSPPAVCAPLAIRHHFPQARVIMVPAGDAPNLPLTATEGCPLRSEIARHGAPDNSLLLT